MKKEEEENGVRMSMFANSSHSLMWRNRRRNRSKGFPVFLWAKISGRRGWRTRRGDDRRRGSTSRPPRPNWGRRRRPRTDHRRAWRSGRAEDADEGDRGGDAAPSRRRGSSRWWSCTWTRPTRPFWHVCENSTSIDGRAEINLKKYLQYKFFSQLVPANCRPRPRGS